MDPYPPPHNHKRCVNNLTLNKALSVQRMRMRCRITCGMALSRILRISTRVVNNTLYSSNDVSRAAGSKAPSTTIFSRILNKELPADIVYEDDKVDSL